MDKNKSRIFALLPVVIVFQIILLVWLFNIEKLEYINPSAFPYKLEISESAVPSDTVLSNVRFFPDSLLSYANFYTLTETECFLMNPSFGLQQRYILGKSINSSNTKVMDVDGDGFDEILFVRNFLRTIDQANNHENLDSIQFCFLDNNNGLVIFDQLNRPQEWPEDVPWKIDVTWERQIAESNRDIDYFIVSLSDNNYNEPYYSLRIYKKDSLPVQIAESRIASIPTQGFWKLNKDSLAVFTFGNRSDCFGSSVPAQVYQNSGSVYLDSLNDYEANYVQVDQTGRFRWINRLDAMCGTTDIIGLTEDRSLLTGLIRPGNKEAENTTIVSIDLNTGQLQDSKTIPGNYIPFSGQEVSNSNVTGIVWNKDKTFNIINDGGSISRQLKLKSFPSESLPLMKLADGTIVFSSYNQKSPSFIYNLKGYRIATVDGARVIPPTYPEHGRLLRNHIPVRSGSTVALYQLVENPSKLWLLKRYHLALIILIPFPLLLLTIYFVGRYAVTKTQVKQEREYYTETLERRVEERTVELERLNNSLQTEILARSQAEHDLRQQREHLEAIFNNVNDGMVTIDLDATILRVNKRFCELLSIGRYDIEQSTLSNWITTNWEIIRSQIQETRESFKSINDTQVEIETADGIKIFRVSSSLLRQKKGRIAEVLLVFRDVTHLHHLQELVEDRNKFGGMVGKSQAMQEIYKMVEDLSDSLSTVLITGDSGTGKELVASALHFSSERADGPFIKVNCSALPENLLESELFGHVKGAFTGANKDRTGRFQAARNGTIFLDEIGDISPRMQLGLLRVLQEGEFERVGDSKTLKTNARIIAATNKNLQAQISDGQFREDLYYRLNVVTIHIPPLRDREEDIALIVEHFRQQLNDETNKAIEPVTGETLEMLIKYPWPGNVRELRNAMERAFIVCHDNQLVPSHFPQEISKSPAQNILFTARSIVSESSSVEDEKSRLTSILDETLWNVSEAARRVGISRQAMYKKIRKLKLQRPGAESQ